MPASARITIEKMYQGEYWTNVYFVDTTVESGGATALALVEAERAVHMSQVLFTKFRIDDNTENTDVYYTGIINTFGVRSAAAADLVALFNVVRVDFQAATGRPSRKYLRGCLQESFVAFQTIDPAQVTFIQTNYADVVAGLTGYVDVDGENIVGGVVYPLLAMRQLRRGSKKRITP
jgi:hypothetical protein